MAGWRYARAEELSLCSQQDSGCSVVVVRGEVDISTAPQLSRFLDARLEEAGQALVVDVNHVTFLGAAGLAALVDARARANRCGRRFRILAAHSPVCRYLALVGLEHE